MKILVIEDEVSISRLIREGLEEAGYLVDTALNGKLGLQLAQVNTYNLILLDVMLPGIDGWAICEELRADKNRVPILMLSGEPVSAAEVARLGADGAVLKPFDLSALIAQIRTHLEGPTPAKLNEDRVGR